MSLHIPPPLLLTAVWLSLVPINGKSFTAISCVVNRWCERHCRRSYGRLRKMTFSGTFRIYTKAEVYLHTRWPLEDGNISVQWTTQNNVFITCPRIFRSYYVYTFLIMDFSYSPELGNVSIFCWHFSIFLSLRAEFMNFFDEISSRCKQFFFDISQFFEL